MKKLLLLFGLFVFTGCGNYPTFAHKDNLFVVSTIKVVNSYPYCYYYSSNNGYNSIIGQKIVCPCGWYNIGDTIRLK